MAKIDFDAVGAGIVMFIAFIWFTEFVRMLLTVDLSPSQILRGVVPIVFSCAVILLFASLFAVLRDDVFG